MANELKNAFDSVSPVERVVTTVENRKITLGTTSLKVKTYTHGNIHIIQNEDGNAAVFIAPTRFVWIQDNGTVESVEANDVSMTKFKKFVETGAF